MKPIETRYKGYKFRSRLEARYAVFFDALDIEWEYEFEGYVLPNGEYYLPDFWLPRFNGGMYVEVKPVLLTSEEKEKCYLLCEGKQCAVWMAVGVPELRCYEVFYWVTEPPYVTYGDGLPNADQMEGKNCMFVFSGYGEVGGLISPQYHDLLGFTFPYAVKKAKAARFEFGENG